MSIRTSVSIRFLAFGCLLVLLAAPSPSDQYVSGLSANKVIESKILGYELQYRVFVPENVQDDTLLPVLYVTDGQWYIERGNLPRLMASMIEDGMISPAIAVFVDNREPGNLSNNRRNRQFFCNDEYVRFFQEELVPSIESEYAARPNRIDRTILGLSFGGLNSACFGLMASETFRGVAMQSPAMHPVRTIHSAFRDSANLDLKIFLSTGTLQDNEDAARRLRDIIQEKEYEMSYVEVPYGHSWENWKPLLDDVLTYFYAEVNSE